MKIYIILLFIFGTLSTSGQDSSKIKKEKKMSEISIDKKNEDQEMEKTQIKRKKKNRGENITQFLLNEDSDAGINYDNNSNNQVTTEVEMSQDSDD